MQSLRAKLLRETKVKIKYLASIRKRQKLASLDIFVIYSTYVYEYDVTKHSQATTLFMIKYEATVDCLIKTYSTNPPKTHLDSC